MERGVWTDERIDDLLARSDRQFDLLVGEIHKLRDEMGELRNEFRTEMRDMRREMHEESTRIRRDMFHGAIALFAAQVAMYATIVVQH